MKPSLWLISPSCAVPSASSLRRASQRLHALGFEVQLDADATARHQGLAGSDAQRLAALHRTAAAAPAVAMATQGGHGLTRLLDGIDWRRLARSVERGTRWVGHGDFAALQLGLLAHTGAGSWAGPLACEDFGAAADPAPADGGVDAVTAECFVEAMDGSLEALGFRTEAGFDGLAARGRLWGGQLSVLLSLLGTRHWPAAAVRGGVLFLHDDEPAWRVERGLLHLRQAGVLQAQRAVLLGPLSGGRAASRGTGALKAVLARVREGLRTPLLPGLPFGHGRPRLSLPLGRRVQLMVQGRDALILW